MRLPRLFAALVILLLSVSCKSQYEQLLAGTDSDAKYKAAFDYFYKGKYQKAAQLFESLSVISNGTARDDTVQYYWGLSNYRFRDYYTAETNFSRFITNFPRSPFTSEARFLRVDCLYRSTYRYELDQAPTHQALAAIAEYRSEFPGNEHEEVCEKMVKDLEARLDTKAFEAARLYYKMEDYKAARVALRNVLKDDADNMYREDVLYYTAMSSYKYAALSVKEKQHDRFLTFEDDYLNFIGEYPNSKYIRELDVMHRRALKQLGRPVGEVASDRRQDRSFERDRSAMGKAGEVKAEALRKEAAAASRDINARQRKDRKAKDEKK